MCTYVINDKIRNALRESNNLININPTSKVRFKERINKYCSYKIVLIILIGNLYAENKTVVDTDRIRKKKNTR